MKRDSRGRGVPVARTAAVVAAMMLVAAPGPSQAQVGNDVGEWTNINGDFTSARYSPLDQIDESNFWQLQVAWEWEGEEDAGIDLGGAVNARSLPVYADGRLITTAGPKRTVVALDPATGETLWTFQEPETFRWEYSMRKNHGKGVSYAEIDGQGVVYITTPAFFLHALDAETGEPLDGWGEGVPLDDFPRTGSVDLLPDLLDGWGPWEDYEGEYDPYQGIPLELGYITSSSPPIVVNDVVIVGNSAEQGYNQTRIENVPGDILAYDARTGEFLWKFHVIPRPGEYGHETWENDAWYWSGNIGSWAPMSADPELGLVYIPTKGGVMDFYGGFRPGDNLFGNSVIALDVETGERVWHYQLVRHDIWNYDTPVAPVMLDVEVDGEEIPGIFQASKQSFLYAFNRETGEPIWPIEDRPVPQSNVPGEQLPETQPFPTWPLPYDLQGRSEEDLIDYTPEVREKAYELAVEGNHFTELFEPPTHRGNEEGDGPARHCPGNTGGVNITGPATGDPTTGVMYITSHSGCGSVMLVPGEEAPLEQDPDALQQGTTVADWARSLTAGPHSEVPEDLDGLPIWQGPQGRITAIDMNTGEHLWAIPHGDAPTEEQETIRNHPLLEDVDEDEVMVDRGRGGHSAMLTTETLLMATGQTSEGTNRLFAIDKETGERVGQVETPSLGRYGIMTYMHEGLQYVVLPRQGGYTTLALPRSTVD